MNPPRERPTPSLSAPTPPGLEPDLTDYARDRRADGALLGTAPVLDEARAAHLAQARDAVRACAAAAHSGRDAGTWAAVFWGSAPVGRRCPTRLAVSTGEVGDLGNEEMTIFVLGRGSPA